jgi:SAM-dependent methyltransferase
LTDVLEHVFKPWQVIAEVSRTLKSGGKMILAVPFYYWIHERPHDYFRYTEFALRRVCEENHLEVLRLEPYGGVPEIVCDIASKTLATTRLGRILCSILLRAAIPMLRVNLIRWISKRTCRLFPIGYCLVALKRGEN